MGVWVSVLVRVGTTETVPVAVGVDAAAGVGVAVKLEAPAAVGVAVGVALTTCRVAPALAPPADAAIVWLPSVACAGTVRFTSNVPFGRVFATGMPAVDPSQVMVTGVFPGKPSPCRPTTPPGGLLVGLAVRLGLAATV